MSKKFLNILIVSVGITIFGLLLDDDVKELSTMMRFTEFFAMTGIIFIISFSINELINFTKKRISLSRNR